MTKRLDGETYGHIFDDMFFGNFGLLNKARKMREVKPGDLTPAVDFSWVENR